jgi:hypothetical protein
MKKFFVLIVVLLASCSNLEKKEEDKAPVYISSETEDEFASIENQDSPYSKEAQDAARRYQRLREQSWENYIQKQQVAPTKKRIRKSPQQTKPKVSSQAKRLSPEKVKELEIESEQMINYFCMKNRNNRKFSNQDYCKEYANDVLRQCKARNYGHISRSVVRCLKSRLRV